MAPRSSAWEGADRRQPQKPVTTYDIHVQSTTNTMEKQDDATCAEI
jgi:hypothetical protein